jgi:hypothetical protein
MKIILRQNKGEYNIGGGGVVNWVGLKYLGDK